MNNNLRIAFTDNETAENAARSFQQSANGADNSFIITRDGNVLEITPSNPIIQLLSTAIGYVFDLASTLGKATTSNAATVINQDNAITR